MSRSIEAIDALLPQTQCGDCGHAGCLPYAIALAAGKDSIDRCPPGGGETVVALGKLLGIDSKPYLSQMKALTRSPAVAFIREDECIGCTKCIQACPVDAILGSGKLMHTIIAKECTGCGLCVDPCPVNCIDMLPLPTATYDKELARSRFKAREERLLKDAKKSQTVYQKNRQVIVNTNPLDDVKAKQDYILKALARVQAKKNR